VKIWNRRTTLTRALVIVGLNRRAECWRHQPSIIASNNAGSGRNGVAPSTNTNAAEPANFLTTRHLRRPLRQMHHCAIRRNNIGCNILATAIAPVVDTSSHLPQRHHTTPTPESPES
jgi:hypothetical protein